jgi:tripartite-type tricarboxylate transporter receptor subunit TctC
MRSHAVVIALCLLFAPPLQAQTRYPSKAVRLIVPFPPGGGNDILGRIVAARLGERLGEQVIVDNRGGAAGIVGTELAARATPDGHTLLMGAVSTISINPVFYDKLPFDTTRDLAPISLIGSTPSMLVVHTGLPVKSVGELVSYARARPGKLAFASAGNGSSHHLAGELLKMMAKIDLIHVPYKGTGPAVNDVVAGHVALVISNIPSVLPLVQAEKLRALAVTSPKRSAIVPDLPTVAESGLPGYDVEIWYGLLAPKGVPAAVIARLNAELTAILALPEVRQRMASLGADAGSSTPAAFAKRIRDDMAKWGRVIKVSGAQPS